nr:hypothetical protein [Tanacetum cinerariifolium]
MAWSGDAEWTKGEGGGGCSGVMEAARDGEWYMGSDRSGGREHFWFWPEDSSENFSGGDGWPEMVVADGRIGRKLWRTRWSVCYIFLL